MSTKYNLVNICKEKQQKIEIVWKFSLKRLSKSSAQ